MNDEVKKSRSSEKEKAPNWVEDVLSKKKQQLKGVGVVLYNTGYHILLLNEI